MPVFFYSLFLGLLLATQLPTTALAFKAIEFSNITQCGPFNISFSAGKLPAALPLTLTVLPFDSAPISIALPDPNWDAETKTGDAITFLPLAAGTSFIASLDDANGNGVALVSDIIKIQPSDDTSCLQQTNATQRQYTVESTLTQCQPALIAYDTSVHNSSPSVRTLIPRGPSYFLNQTQDGSVAMEPPYQVASYEMTAFRGNQVVLLFSDGAGYREASNLTTVEGDTASSTSCLSFFTSGNMDGNNLATASAGGIPSKTVIAIAASIGSIIILIALMMGVYAWRHRRRHPFKKIQGIEGGPGFDHPRGLGQLARTPSPKIAEKAIPAGGSPYLANPPYPVEKYTGSPTTPEFLQQPSRGDLGYGYQQNSSSEIPVITRSFSLSVSPPTTNSNRQPQQMFSQGLTVPVVDHRHQSKASSVDIDHVLDLATMYSSERESRVPKPLTPESPRTPYSAYSNIVISPQAGIQESHFPPSPISAEAEGFVIDRSWEPVDPVIRGHARKSSGAITHSLPERPEPVVTRDVGRGAKLPYDWR